MFQKEFSQMIKIQIVMPCCLVSLRDNICYASLHMRAANLHIAEMFIVH